MLFSKMMGKKMEMDDATVMMKLKHWIHMSVLVHADL